MSPTDTPTHEPDRASTVSLFRSVVNPTAGSIPKAGKTSWFGDNRNIVRIYSHDGFTTRYSNCYGFSVCVALSCSLESVYADTEAPTDGFVFHSITGISNTPERSRAVADVGYGYSLTIDTL